MLLTDLHMPDVDGYTLASTIRYEEAGRQRMPIIALTANALRGEAHRAHLSGMDEYLTKPVKLDLLRSSLAKWMPADAAADVRSSARTVSGNPANGVVDLDVLKSLVGDNESIIRDFLAHFLTSASATTGELREACNDADYRKVGAIAHKLKSSSRSMGAIRLSDFCAGLESACRVDDHTSASQYLAHVEEEMAAVLKHIEALLAERQA